MSEGGKSFEKVALAGYPNVGKTTLFNVLTGKNERTGNFAGVTVEKRESHFFTPHGRKVRLVDLPGTYGLAGESADQRVAVDFLLGEEAPDVIVHVVDAAALERHLQMTLDLLDCGKPLVVALNMVDRAEAMGIRLDPSLISEELGVPVVPIVAERGKGVVELKQALRYPLPSVAEKRWAEGREERAAWVAELCERAARRPDAEQLMWSDRMDSWLLHRVWGWVFFSLMMCGVFWAIFSLAEYPMSWLEAGQGVAQEWASGFLPEGELRDLIVDGVIGGAGSTLVFLPQILMLFFFIALMEGSGYMARAAYLMDGPMSREGLSGKAFLPFLSSYACAIPGVMAARTVDSAKERLVTIFVAPWMSCAARLPVYLLLVPMLLGGAAGTWKQALVMAAVYLCGTFSALVVAFFLRKKLGVDEQAKHFLLELPPYRLPSVKYVVRMMVERGWAFVKRAGGVILALSVVLWAMNTYPRGKEGDSDAEKFDKSLLGRLGKVIEPVMSPMGHDGRTGAAVLASFAAREVFASSMAIVHGVEQSEEETDESARQRLRGRMMGVRRENGSRMFTVPALLSLLVFFIYALQCLPTSVVVARESGSWKWAAGQFFFMSLFAWFTAVLVYQVGSRFFL